MAFSGALTLTDLNDYLGPSQACIKPVEGKAGDGQQDGDNAADEQDAGGAASTQIAIDRDGTYYESASKAVAATQQSNGKPRERTKLETAEISLDDCLACSGCVTSAESVLITMQSQEEMRRAIEEMNTSGDRKLLVASISPQTLASLAARYSFDEEQQASGSAAASTASGASNNQASLRLLLHRISHFLKARFGFDHVLDTTFARHISLKEHEREFFERRANSLKRKRGDGPDLNSLRRGATDTNTDEPTLPMLASACPGWICYAEKTHGELLPYVSRTKSPQQISGVIAKKFISSRLGVGHEHGTDAGSSTQPPQLSGVYHVTVMPCYDKKLEASRPDFFDEITGTKEVDCVLTTGELDKLMEEEGFDLRRPVDGEADLRVAKEADDLSLADALGSGHSGRSAADSSGTAVTVLPHLPTLLDHPGSSSGGYLFNLMRAVWLDWLGQVWDSLPSEAKTTAAMPQLDVKIIRTSDFTEYVLRAPALAASSGSFDSQGASAHNRPILFRAAQCYGFRNLQNLVRKLQRQTGVKSAKGAAGRLVDADGRALGNGVGGRGRVARGRGRGMVRRGRGGTAGLDGAGSRTGIESEPGSGASTPALASTTDGDDEEAHGYDYVEVMACPSGCVNGGGQLRPPTGSDALEIKAGDADGDEDESSTVSKTCSKRELDPEGYTVGWASDQSATSPSAAAQDIKMLDLGDLPASSGEGQKASKPAADESEDKEIKGWQGTSKEWVRRVEKAYWASSRFSHGPVGAAYGSTFASGAATPVRGTSAQLSGAGAAAKRDARPEDKARILDALISSSSPAQPSAAATAVESVRVQPNSLIYADVLAELVTTELSVLAAASSSLPQGKGSADGEQALSDARKRLLRTEYRAVKDENVSGLAVQW